MATGIGESDGDARKSILPKKLFRAKGPSYQMFLDPSLKQLILTKKDFLPIEEYVTTFQRYLAMLFSVILPIVLNSSNQ